MQMQAGGNQRQLISRLIQTKSLGGAGSGSGSKYRIESSLAGRRARANSSERQQTGVGSKSAGSERDELISGGSMTSDHSDAHIRAQLISGKVPPVVMHKSHPNHLLAPDSMAGGLGGQSAQLGHIADSLDNLASLIPR